MNTSQTIHNNPKEYNVLEKEVTPTFAHRYGSGSIEDISYSGHQTTSVITLLISQFNSNQEQKVDSETIFYGITTARCGIDDINVIISTVKDNSSIKACSAIDVMASTIEEMIEKIKAVLDLLHEQFSNDEKGCLNDETINSILKSVRADVSKIVNVADDFIGLVENHHT